MPKFVEALKGKFAAYKEWAGEKLTEYKGRLAVKLGNARVAELEALNAEGVELLVLAGQFMDVAKRNQTGAMNAFGLLQQQQEQADRNAAVTIAALLTVSGGEVQVTADTIAACEKADITIDYFRAEDGTVTLRLVPPEEVAAAARQAELDAAAEDELDDEDDTDLDEGEKCDGDCGCGQKPEAPAQAA